MLEDSSGEWMGEWVTFFGAGRSGKRVEASGLVGWGRFVLFAISMGDVSSIWWWWT